MPWWASISPVECFKSKADLFFSAAPKTLQIASATSPPSLSTIIYQGNFWLLLGENVRKKLHVIFQKTIALKQHFSEGGGVSHTVCIFFLVPICPVRNVWLPYWKFPRILISELCPPFNPQMTFRPPFKVIFITLSQEGPNTWEAMSRAALLQMS